MNSRIACFGTQYKLKVESNNGAAEQEEYAKLPFVWKKTHITYPESHAISIKMLLKCRDDHQCTFDRL